MPVAGTQAQRAAIQQLWPDIGPYCLRNGLPRHRLLSGHAGIPVDSGKLQDLRDEKLISRLELARMMGVSRDTVTKIENGVRNPTPAMLAALVRALGCAPGDLLPSRAPAGSGISHTSDIQDQVLARLRSQGYRS